MGYGDHVSSPDSIDRGIAEEKYKENETKDDGIETKNAVHTPPVQEDDYNERTDDELEKKFQCSLLLLIWRDMKVKSEYAPMGNVGWTFR